MSQLTHYSKILLPLVGALVISACSTTSEKGAPIVEHSANAQEAKVLPPVGPGYYRIKRGDTLYRIALEHGQSYRDIASWNNLSNPNQIEVDQLLRVIPPEGAAVTTAAVGGSRIEGRPLDDKKVGTVKPAVKPNGDSSTDQAKATDGAISLSWPNQGAVLAKFDESKNKGIDIAGKVGDPVVAAADGKVVYAGNSLRGYGNLIILKHDEVFLTAYAHNSRLLVAEGDVVKRGAKIALMGDSDATRVKLHFEVRKNGKPVDPLRYLPNK